MSLDRRASAAADWLEVVGLGLRVPHGGDVASEEVVDCDCIGNVISRICDLAAHARRDVRAFLADGVLSAENYVDL